MAAAALELPPAASPAAPALVAPIAAAPPLRPRATVGGMWPVLAMRAPNNRFGFARILLGMVRKVRQRQRDHRLEPAWATWECHPFLGGCMIWVELG